MSSFNTLLISGKKVKVPIEAGTTLSLSNITLDTNKKNKGTIQVRAKPANSETKDGYVVGDLSSETGKSSAALSLSFDSSNSPVELWIVGNGKVTVVGTHQAVVAPSKKAKSTASKKDAAGKNAAPAKVEEVPIVEPVVVESSKKDNQSYKKRKAAALEGAEEKEAHEVKQINIKKFWKVKPQNGEGVLVNKVKPVYRLENLKVADYVIGNGDIPAPGSTVKITYTGLLPDGTVFDARMKRLQPFVFRKGVNQVVKGLDLGLEGMKVGGSREITVPPELG